ncbi:uncharacterized protein [Aristolochia californica]|uniref:uncharacterized protein n=1 Tax=Aristolochia californica TaxID=171875 RepID=UPI0035DBD3DC
MTRAAIIHLLRSQEKQLTVANFQTGVYPSRLGTCQGHSTLQNPFAYKYVNLNHTFMSTHKKCASHVAATTTESDSKISIGPQKNATAGEDGKETAVVYQGPISSTIKKVKLLSLSTCCLSISLGPVITFMTAPEMNVILKGAIASSVIFMSATSTGILHWFANPYIHKLKWQPGSDVFEVQMMSWLASYIPRTLRFADVRLAQTNRPFVTFAANGNYYFIDKDHCHNKALLAKLTPRQATHESAFKNL